MLDGRIGIAVDEVLTDRPEDDVECELGQAALRPGSEDRVCLPKCQRLPAFNSQPVDQPCLTL